ncbi:hypothetical protein TNCV_831291 [Trichonephila clavipes]|nr:hypothetical protein TNCV_831291 [Trichonephila clavipes]
MQHASLECLFGLYALGIIKFQVLFCIVKAQVPPSRKKTGRQNYISVTGIPPKWFRNNPDPANVCKGTVQQTGQSHGKTGRVAFVLTLEQMFRAPPLPPLGTRHLPPPLVTTVDSRFTRSKLQGDRGEVKTHFQHVTLQVKQKFQFLHCFSYLNRYYA